jgi:putative transposase
MNTKPMAMLLTMLAGWINRQQSEIIEYLMAENSILKEELLKATAKKRIILNDKQRRKLAILGKKLGRRILGTVCASFSPDTVLGWHRKLVANKYDGSKHRKKSGRPRISEATRLRVVEMAKNNKHLGVGKLHGYLKYLGITVSRTSISRILREYGIDPCPDRPEKTTWNEFIKSHWDSLVAIDFFTTEVYTIGGLTRYMVLIAIDYKTRKVEIAGIIPQAHKDWMKIMARHLSDPFDGFLKNKKYLIMDRDPLFCKDFIMILKAGGIECKKISKASPNMNPLAERYVQSIKHEALNRMLIFGERHLRHVVSEYVDYYNHCRPHQSLNQNMIEPLAQGDGEIECIEHLGGLLKSYRRAS